jgi:hypothetical protein
MVRVLVCLPFLYMFSMGITLSHAGTYAVCQGEYSEIRKGSKCPSGQPYVYCPAKNDATNAILTQKAASLCKQEGSSGKPNIVHLRSEGGNSCGYGFFQVTCN